MPIAAKVEEWRDRYIASFETDHPEEAEFWRNELADPWAAEYWYEFDQQHRPVEKAGLVQAV